MSQVASNRLLSLDVMRGITIAGMILVSNPGTWDYIYSPLGHSPWHHITPTDVVFPFFMFIMGVSVYISLRKFDFCLNRSLGWKILRRVLLIFLIGIGLIWFSVFCWKFASLCAEGNTVWQSLTGSFFCLHHIPLSGVLPRLAICYGVAAVVATVLKHKYIWWLIGGILLVYYIVLALGNGFELDRTNILSIVDYWVFGAYYMEDRILDAEGILSTFPAIAHVLIGFSCGKLMMENHDKRDKIVVLFIIGGVMTFSGLLLSYACPINKLIWSPTFVLTTCGFASTFLALLLWTIDIKGYKRWSFFFQVFGVNPLFLYVLSHVLAALLDNCSFVVGGEIKSIHYFIYMDLLQPAFGNYLSSLVYALLFVGLNWCIGYCLYRKKIYIKI